MADVSSSRVYTRSGSVHRVPLGMTCDDHPERPATVRVQGETDSFGCEYIDWCKECHDKYLAYRFSEPREPRYFED